MILLHKEYGQDGLLLTFENYENPFLIRYFSNFYYIASKLELGKDYSMSEIEQLQDDKINVKSQDINKELLAEILKSITIRLENIENRLSSLETIQDRVNLTKFSGFYE